MAGFPAPYRFDAASPEGGGANLTAAILAAQAGLLPLPPSRKGPGPCTPAVLNPFRTRDMLGLELRRLNLTGVGVEVGAVRGFFTRVLLERWASAGLYIQTDTWAPGTDPQRGRWAPPAPKGSAAADGGAEEQLEAMRMAYERGQEMVQRGKVGSLLQCRGAPYQCAQQIPDATLDFVYLAAHVDRVGTISDLRTFWPKLRQGGVMAGGGYTEQREPRLVRWGAHETMHVCPVAGGLCSAWHHSDPERMGMDWVQGADGSLDESGRAVRGAVDDFFSGEDDSSLEEFRTCPRQVTVAYREPWFNNWAVRK